MYRKVLTTLLLSSLLMAPKVVMAGDIAPATPDYRTAEVVEAEAYLSKSPTAAAIIKKAHAGNIFYRVPSKNENDHCETAFNQSEKAAVIFWHPHMANMVDDGSSKMISPALLLVHEMIHATHYFDDAGKYEERSEKNDIKYDTQEERATIAIERQIAMELGEYQRETHHGRYIDVGSITGK